MTIPSEHQAAVLQRFKELLVIKDHIAKLHCPLEVGNDPRIVCRECFKPHPCPTLRLTRGEGLGSPDQT